jgi:hypothetical protein
VPTGEKQLVQASGPGGRRSIAMDVVPGDTAGAPARLTLLADRELIGHVVEAGSGAAIEGVEVGFRQRADDPVDYSAGARSDESGRFLIALPCDGVTALELRSASHVTRSIPASELGPGDDVEVSLQPAGALLVKLGDVSGDPLAVEVFNEEDQRMTITQGHTCLFTGLVPGHYHVSVSKEMASTTHHEDEAEVDVVPRQLAIVEP